MNKFVKRTLIVILIVLVLFVAALLFASNYLIDFAIKRQDSFNTMIDPQHEEVRSTDSIKAKFEAHAEAYFKNVIIKKPTILSSDGLELKANLYANDTNKYVLMIHGYMGAKEDMMKSASVFHSWGFNVLTPDNRAHGESEGEYVGMGWLDAMDMLQWIDYILSFDSSAQIVIYGISMGGATAMNLSGMDIPGNVYAIIEDCGYSSLIEIFSDELKAVFGLPSFPLLNLAIIFGRIRAGYDFRDASSMDMVAKSKVPMLFIHGTGDNFVGYYMLDKVYNAKINGYKEVLRVDGAGHAESNLIDPELYYETIENFLNHCKKLT